MRLYYSALSAPQFRCIRCTTCRVFSTYNMNFNARLRTGLLVAVSLFFVITIALLIIQPTKPAHALQRGISSPIIGLEMALSPYEVWSILGDPQTPFGQSTRAAFTLGTYVDFGYILAYSLSYLLLTWLMAYRQSAHWGLLLVTAVLVVVTATADVIENLALFRILDTGTVALVDLHIDQLIVFTRIKWLSLGLMGLPAMVLFRREQRRGPAFLLTTAFALGALGIVKQYAPEIMSLFLAFFWVFIFIKLLPLKNRWWV